MAITKDKKRDILAKLSEALGEAQATAFVGFSKLTVADASLMRRALKEAGVAYFVSKKTLLKRALAEHGYAGTVPELPGEVAIAWTTAADTTLPARSIYDEGKRLKGAVKLLGGIFEGAFADAARVTELATIPPMPILRGMFVNVINSPIQGLVIALDKIREQRA